MNWIDGIILGAALIMAALLIVSLIKTNRRGGSCAACASRTSRRFSSVSLLKRYRKKYRLK